MHYKDLFKLENLELIDFDVQNELNRQETSFNSKKERNERLLNKIDSLQKRINMLTQKMNEEIQEKIFEIVQPKALIVVRQNMTLLTYDDDKLLKSINKLPRDQRSDARDNKINQLTHDFIKHNETGFREIINDWIEDHPKEMEVIMDEIQEASKIKLNKLKQLRQEAIDQLGLAEFDKAAYYDPGIPGLKTAIAATLLQIPIYELDDFSKKMSMYNTKYVPEYLCRADKALERFGFLGKIYTFLKEM